ncbi:HPP domain-containing protein [Macrophomina phaseolina MS6]|uniref:HPP domain-containing protein n=2 Tax=Macrophomina phaseolina TaxID=35725 RepID=K2RYE3_MACPH|nr:HPP domain-containing protein [Macrophomina phaseolina MS6]KAH7010932.1 HPP family protein [Macrophomina phaseolina]
MLPRAGDRLGRIPPWASRWLGYRASPPAPLSPYLVYFWSFIAAFCGLSVLQAIFNYSDYFKSRHVPGIIASYGASAVLVYGAPQAPLAQPRAVLGGHFLSALIGICITKLFSLMPSDAKFESLRWLAASLSTSIAIVVMQVTDTTHPPAGATALLPAVDADIWNLSWYYLPVVLLSSVMVLAVALLINNIQRAYPVYWIAPTPPSKVQQQPSESPKTPPFPQP